MIRCRRGRASDQAMSSHLQRVHSSISCDRSCLRETGKASAVGGEELRTCAQGLCGPCPRRAIRWPGQKCKEQAASSSCDAEVSISQRV